MGVGVVTKKKKKKSTVSSLIRVSRYAHLWGHDPDGRKIFLIMLRPPLCKTDIVDYFNSAKPVLLISW